MSRRILFVCNFRKEAQSARLNYERSLLEAEGYEVDIIYKGEFQNYFLRLITYLTLKFINAELAWQAYRIASRYDLVVLYGAHVLPAAFFMRDRHERVIYQTLNHDIVYHIYELAVRSRLVGVIARIVAPVFRFLEKKISVTSRATIVNSRSLKEYLPWSTLNYYTSPLEDLKIRFDPGNPFALLYLGQLREEKGTSEIRWLLENHTLDLHFYGSPRDEAASSLIEHPRCHSHGNLPAEQLAVELEQLSRKCNLVGLSIIYPVHQSYATQEANKEIDYMAMGIPFIANERTTALEKVNRGCGSVYPDATFLTDFNAYMKSRENCYQLYRERYSNEHFKRVFFEVFH